MTNAQKTPEEQIAELEQKLKADIIALLKSDGIDIDPDISDEAFEAVLQDESLDETLSEQTKREIASLFMSFALEVALIAGPEAITEILGGNLPSA